MQDSDDANKSFKTRSTFARILPAEFNLNEIFDKIQPNNLEDSGESGEKYNSDLDKDILECNCRLTYLIGYILSHFVSFVRHDKTWYICEDSDTFYIGNSADLFDYLERRSVLPYIVFYQTCEDELDETPEFDKTVRDTNKRDEVIKSEKRKVKNDKGVGELRNESMNKDYNDINKILNQATKKKIPKKIESPKQPESPSHSSNLDTNGAFNQSADPKKIDPKSDQGNKDKSKKPNPTFASKLYNALCCCFKATQK